MPSEPTYHTWREFLTPKEIREMEEAKAARIARGKPPELPWRQIAERLFSRLMDWETDYEPQPHERCVSDMYSIFEEFEEAWQDLAEWELRQEAHDAVSS